LSSGTSNTGDAGGSQQLAALPSGPQTPPQNGADVETWLAAGSYKSWHCEAAPHASRSPSPHHTDRVCSNDLASAFSGTGERPKGTASVKELYGADGGATIVGYAVSLKMADTSDNGNNWYWYERVPLDDDFAHDSKGIAADGLGTDPTANAECASCHSFAGHDAKHTPLPGSSDNVYTQVK
jgi:hypothetical protein